MRIDICDVCRAEDNVIQKSKYRAGFPHSVKVDLCEKHKNWVHSLGTREKFVAEYVKLLEKQTTI